MKEEALALVAPLNSPSEKLNLLREYLQAFVLRSLHESEAFHNLSFVGGTALRFLYRLARFSEDLDFSLEHSSGYEPERWLKKMKTDLQLAGFLASVRIKEERTVQIVWIRIEGLLQEVGLTDIPSQKLSLKLEIDTHPPAGAVCVSEVVHRHMTFVVQHHDLPSLMAGKIHALTVRRYDKGRDWYDLLWYLAQRPPVEPNPVLLQNALDQTEGTGTVKADRWRESLRERLKRIKENRLVEDVQAFLERPADAALLRVEHILSVL